MNNQSTPANPGSVVSVRGSVVDVRFNAQLPPIYSVLRAGAESTPAAKADPKHAVEAKPEANGDTGTDTQAKP